MLFTVNLKKLQAYLGHHGDIFEDNSPKAFTFIIVKTNTPRIWGGYSEKYASDYPKDMVYVLNGEGHKQPNVLSYTVVLVYTWCIILTN